MKRIGIAATIAVLGLLVGLGTVWLTDTDARTETLATADWTVSGRPTLTLAVGTVYEAGSIDLLGTKTFTCQRSAVPSILSVATHNSIPIHGMEVVEHNLRETLAGMPLETGTYTYAVRTACRNEGSAGRDRRSISTSYMTVTTTGTLPAHCADYWRTSHCNDKDPDLAVHSADIDDLEAEIAALKAKVAALEAASHSTHATQTPVDLSGYATYRGAPESSVYSKASFHRIICGRKTDGTYVVPPGTSLGPITCPTVAPQPSGQDEATPTPVPTAPAPSAPTPSPRD